MRSVARCVLLAVGLLLLGGGCVQRRLMVRTNPPGALLYVDDHEIGITPVAADFTYYGTRKITLVKDGYETLTTTRWIPPPWYEVPPLDFVSENFVPGQIRDQRPLDFQLRPQAVTSSPELIGRAEQLRRDLHSATGTAPIVAPAPAGPMGVPPAAGQPIVVPEGVGGQQVHPLPLQ
ncbi:MAG: PEGA domain-containing protein [Thermoguttaceae bacterium]